MISETVHDVVCHMDIDPATAAAKVEHEGETYYFCAVGCERDFSEDPVAILKAEAEHDHSAAMDHGTPAPETAAGRSWWQFWHR